MNSKPRMDYKLRNDSLHMQGIWDSELENLHDRMGIIFTFAMTAEQMSVNNAKSLMTTMQMITDLASSKNSVPESLRAKRIKNADDKEDGEAESDSDQENGQSLLQELKLVQEQLGVIIKKIEASKS